MHLLAIVIQRKLATMIKMKQNLKLLQRLIVMRVLKIIMVGREASIQLLLGIKVKNQGLLHHLYSVKQTQIKICSLLLSNEFDKHILITSKRQKFILAKRDCD